MAGKTKERNNLMSQITQGSTVSIEFTGRLNNGAVFGEATPEKPLSFVVGRNQMLPGMEEAVIGMAPGESKTTVIPPEKGYGRRSGDHVITVPREKLPSDFKEGVDARVQLNTKQGETVSAQVINTTETDVVLDANHPLAGETLTVDLRVLAVD